MKVKRDFTEKPYNRCLFCPHRKVRCDGPRTSAMELLRWCEFMRDMKELNELTNAEIAKRADVSVKTVEQIMAMRPGKDIQRDTARRIEDAIIGSSNQYPCYLAFEESAPEDRKKHDEAVRELERALADNRDYREALDKIHASYNAEMQFIRDDAQKKIDFLLAQIERLQRDNDRKGEMIDKFVLEKFGQKNRHD